MSFSYPGGIISSTENVPKTTPPYCSGVWKLSEAAYWVAQGQWPFGPSDPNFENVTLLLNGDGTNGAQNNTFLDSSTNNFTITRNGNTTQGSFSPYGGNWGNYFSSSSLATPSNAAVSDTLLASDFTIECWFFAVSASANGSPLWTNSIANSDGFSTSYLYADGSIGTGKVAVNEFASATGLWTVSTWNHFALVRSGSNLTIYLNGSQIATTASASTYLNTSATKPMAIGRNYQNTPTYFDGYISNFRAVSSALYTTTFTPSTTPLTAISGTQLLTCQSNRFIDNSTNAFALTIGGTPSVQRFSPFEPTAPYSTSVIGGSGYFDGSGDYLSAPANSAFELTGDFTSSFWYYPTAATAGGAGIWDQWNGSTTGVGNWQFWYQNKQLYLFYDGGSYILSSTDLTLNQWHYISATRSGSTITLYLNNVSVGTASFSGTVGKSSQDLYLGASHAGSGYEIQGYISDARIVKGSVITGLPTSPVTNVTNTSILTNFINAGIPDLAMMNNLGTVGDAQVSTSVVKYGTGSLAFDGTGDYLVSNAPTTDLYAFGTGAFTIEFWIYFTSTASVYLIYDTRPSGGNGLYPTLVFDSSTTCINYFTDSATKITGNVTTASGSWHHIAVCRSGTSTKLFVNGTQSGSTYTDSNAYIGATNRPIIGGDGNSVGSNGLNGYIDDLRVTKGVARYTAAFTPPTAALPTY
jgi:hypothetical protein